VKRYQLSLSTINSKSKINLEESMKYFILGRQIEVNNVTYIVIKKVTKTILSDKIVEIFYYRYS